MKVLVTGATGLVGTALVAFLAATLLARVLFGTAFLRTAFFAACFGGLTLLGTAGTPFVTAKCRSNGRPHQRGRPNGTADLTTVIR